MKKLLKNVYHDPAIYVMIGLLSIIVFSFLPIWVEILLLICVGFYIKFRR